MYVLLKGKHTKGKVICRNCLVDMGHNENPFDVIEVTRWDHECHICGVLARDEIIVKTPEEFY